MARNFLSLVLIACTLFLGGCMEDITVSQEPRHFIMDDQDGAMMISLTWQVNGYDDGYNYLDLDLYLSDTSRLTKETFLRAARYPAEADWREQPVLVFSVGARNPMETIYPTAYEHSFDDFRKYLGIAINGQGEKYNTLSGPIMVDYTVTISLNEKAEELTGTFTYQSGWINKTAIKYIATCDIDGLENVYSFRELNQELWVVRSADFLSTNQINVSPGGSRTQQNDRLVVNLDWSVNNTSPGYEHVDLDLISGTSLPGSITGSSESEDNYERISFKTFGVANFQREMGHKYFENIQPGPDVITIQYTYTVYFMDNPFHRFVKSGTIVSPPVNAGSSIYKALSFTKVGDIVTVTP